MTTFPEDNEKGQCRVCLRPPMAEHDEACWVPEVMRAGYEQGLHEAHEEWINGQSAPTDLAVVEEAVERLLTLGVSESRVEPIRDWLRDQRSPLYPEHLERKVAALQPVVINGVPYVWDAENDPYRDERKASPC